MWEELAGKRLSGVRMEFRVLPSIPYDLFENKKLITLNSVFTVFCVGSCNELILK